MIWEIINTKPIVPKCILCEGTTEQMARFTNRHVPSVYIFICSDCGRFVKDCMDKWKDLKPTDYINNHFNTRIDPL